MRAVVQRVTRAEVTVGEEIVGAIEHGLCVLLGVATGDEPDDLAWLCDKIAKLRIFSDEAGRFDQSLIDVGGSCLVVSQFTLLAATKKGTRPSFTAAAAPDSAVPLYEAFIQRMSGHLDGRVASGRFGAAMAVALVNDGPVTLVLDSRQRA